MHQSLNQLFICNMQSSYDVSFIVPDNEGKNSKSGSFFSRPIKKISTCETHHRIKGQLGAICQRARMNGRTGEGGTKSSLGRT